MAVPGREAAAPLPPPARSVGLARTLLRVGSGAALLAGLLLLLHVDASDPTEGAMLRVSIRTAAGTAEVCHKNTEEELAKTPMHMRRPESCESHAVPYRLEVRSNGELLVDRVYSAAGLHGDRPLVVDESLVLPAGAHDVTLHFAPAEDGEQKAPRFAYEGRVDFADGRIRVLALDAADSAFRLL